jgi:hypothetical protein
MRRREFITLVGGTAGRSSASMFCHFNSSRAIVLRQKVLSCREHLAEFYEGRPQLLKRESRALLRCERRDFTGFICSSPNC